MALAARELKQPKKIKLTPSGARWTIIAAANRGSNQAWIGKPYTMRRLNQAVCRVRRFNLVKPSVLKAAGFNVKNRS